MNEDSKPLLWLGVELSSIAALLALYVNFHQFAVVDLTALQTIAVGCLLIYPIYWGSTKIDDSEYTHGGLVWNRLAKPGWRATKQSASNLGKKIPSLGWFLEFLKESDAQRESRKVVDDFVRIACVSVSTSAVV